MSVIIELRNAALGYGRQTVLRSVNLAIPGGAFFVITGPNGGGKTTLLKAVCGLLPPLEGELRTCAKRVGYVPQHSVDRWSLPITARELVDLGASASQPVRSTLLAPRPEIAVDALKKCRAEKLSNKLFFELSGGERQRVLLARALAVQPDVLVLDEPIAAVDSETEETIIALLSKLHHDQQLTILIAGHNPQLFGQTGAQILQVADGDVRPLHPERAGASQE